MSKYIVESENKPSKLEYAPNYCIMLLNKYMEADNRIESITGLNVFDLADALVSGKFVVKESKGSETIYLRDVASTLPGIFNQEEIFGLKEKEDK